MIHWCYRCKSANYITYLQNNQMLCKTCLDDVKQDEQIQKGEYHGPIRSDNHHSRCELLSRVLHSAKAGKG